MLNMRSSRPRGMQKLRTLEEKLSGGRHQRGQLEFRWGWMFRSLLKHLKRLETEAGTWRRGQAADRVGRLSQGRDLDVGWDQPGEMYSGKEMKAQVWIKDLNLYIQKQGEE